MKLDDRILSIKNNKKKTGEGLEMMLRVIECLLYIHKALELSPQQIINWV